MTNKKIKLITYAISSFFIALTILNIYYTQAEPYYSNLKIEIEKNKNNFKNLELELNKIIYQKPLNYDFIISSLIRVSSHTNELHQQNILKSNTSLELSKKIKDIIFDVTTSLTIKTLLESTKKTLLNANQPTLTNYINNLPNDASNKNHPFLIPNNTNNQLQKSLDLAISSNHKLNKIHEKINNQITDYYYLINSYGLEIRELEESSYLKKLIILATLTVILLIFLILTLMLLKELDILVINQAKIIDEKTKEAIHEKNKALEALKIKSSFVANMSHEIRNPLATILGYIELLKNKLKDSKNKKQIECAYYQTKHLNALLNNILDLSKLEENKLEISTTECNPKKEFKELQELYINKILHEKKKINFEILHTNLLPKQIKIDIVKVRQIIFNLSDNAIKFTPENKTIQIITKYDYTTQTLTVEIKDEGIGIDQDSLETIFKPFTQENSSTSNEYGGTGLGLTIAHKLAILMQGTLDVKSQKNQGSTFTLKIPAQLIEVDTQSPALTSFNVLVVDDLDVNQDVFKDLIEENSNHNVEIAPNGASALALYKENPSCFKVILMDDRMPIMSGLEATKAIRKFEEQNNLSPIVIIGVSGKALEEDNEIYINCGMTYHLPKPFSSNELLTLFPKS